MSGGDPPTQLALFPLAQGPARPEPRPADPLPAAAGDLRPRLDRHLRGRLARLVLTENHRRILSVRSDSRQPAALTVRLDACFATAPDEVVAAVAAWIDGEGTARRQALGVLRRHFEASRGGVERPAPRPRALRPQGCRFDLRELRDELDRAFFDGRLEVEISWGRALPRRRRRRPRRRTLRLGSYDYDARLIRIHRALDHPGVPRYVVASVVYHEMLHAALPAPAAAAGRRRLHPPEFRRLEARFPDHERARRWIERHLDALLRRR